MHQNAMISFPTHFPFSSRHSKLFACTHAPGSEVGGNTMGSKSPDGHQQAPDADTNDIKPATPNTNGRGNGSQSADIDRGIVGGGDDDDDDDGHCSDQGAGVNGATTDKTKKKKKKKRSKAKKASKSHQTTPPSVLVSELFSTGEYPVGQVIPYENTSRTTAKEVRPTSRHWDDDFLQDYYHAAEIHRQVRQYAQRHVIKPGVRMSVIADEIDNGVRTLCGHQGLEVGDPLIAGLAFPTGLSLNHVGAHWTPNPGGADPVLGESDVLSVDFGVHVNGRIVDSAFTVANDPVHDDLLTAVKAATNTGLAVRWIPIPCSRGPKLTVPTARRRRRPHRRHQRRDSRSDGIPRSEY